MAPPGRPPPRTAIVLGKQQVTPNMLRVTLGGPAMTSFPAGSQGAYIKFRLFPDGGDRPTVRTYTVRRQSGSGGQIKIDVDFVLHADEGGRHGPATDWALAVEPGASIEIGGPGPAKPLPASSAFLLVAGDMTALPAIAVNLENLPADATGFAAIEIQGEADRQMLATPPGVDIDWIVNPAPGTRPDALVERIRAADPGGDDVYGWAACEFAAMRALRDYLRGERGLGPDRLYISSYWKRGVTEDEHKVVKRTDADAVGS